MRLRNVELASQLKTMCALTAAYQPACPSYNLVPSQAQKENRLMPGLQASFFLHMECISWPVLSKVQQIFNNEKTIWIKHYLDTRDAKCGTCCLWHYRSKTTFTVVAIVNSIQISCSYFIFDKGLTIFPVPGWSGWSAWSHDDWVLALLCTAMKVLVHCVLAV